MTFTVLGPTLTSIAPNAGVRNTSVPVTLTGTNLTGATGLNGLGGGISATAFTVVNSTTITATLNITGGATLGVHNIGVATPIGNTNTQAFTVTAVATPTLTSITPITGVRGSTTVPVTLTGTNLTGASAITAGGGITFNIINVNGAGTQITATFTITVGSALTTRNVRVTTTPGNISPVNPAVTFTVQGATVASISPTSGTHATTVPVTITGNNLTGATAVTMGGGIACTIVGTPTATTVNASCAITNGAARTTRNVSVTTPIGVTPVNPAVTFTVN